MGKVRHGAEPAPAAGSGPGRTGITKNQALGSRSPPCAAGRAGTGDPDTSQPRWIFLRGFFLLHQDIVWRLLHLSTPGHTRAAPQATPAPHFVARFARAGRPSAVPGGGVLPAHHHAPSMPVTHRRKMPSGSRARASSAEHKHPWRLSFPSWQQLALAASVAGSLATAGMV